MQYFLGCLTKMSFPPLLHDQIVERLCGSSRRATQQWKGRTSERTSLPRSMPSNFQYLSKDIDPQLACGVCSLPMKEPVSIRLCNHSFCEECIFKALPTSNECPVCKEKSDSLDIEPAGREIVEQLDLLRVSCPSQVSGCEWTGTRGSLAHHISECSFLTVSCGNKGCPATEILRSSLPAHLRECLHRPVVCDRCETKVTYRDIEDHVDVCEFEPIPCHFCFAMFPRNELSSHIIELCPESSVPCALQRFGCDWSGKRSKIAEHDGECPLRHVSAYLLDQEEETKRLAAENASLKQEQAKLSQIVAKMRADLEQLTLSVLPAIERLSVDSARFGNALAASEVRTGVELNQIRQLIHAVSVRQADNSREHVRRLSDERAMKL